MCLLVVPNRLPHLSFLFGMFNVLVEEENPFQSRVVLHCCTRTMGLGRQEFCRLWVKGNNNKKWCVVNIRNLGFARLGGWNRP